MRVPIGWLKEFVAFDLGVKELSDRLTMAGLEVEGIEEVAGDTVLEVNVTPNRPDCLSVLGVAREVSALLGLPLSFPEHRIGKEEGASCIAVTISDPDLCHRYAGRDIEGVTVAEAPDWMKRRLEQCGIRSINNIVDVTNYVLLELGHPLHAFDRAELKGRRIDVATAKYGDRITTLDGAVRDLPDGALLIRDGERPVAVAGIMGGAESEVTEKTGYVFLESAWFLPTSVRRTSRRLGLKTESAYRFERGTDIENLERALDRAALLMSRLGGGRISSRVDVYPRPFQPVRIEVRFGRIAKVLGTVINRDEILGIVRRLGMAVEEWDVSFIVLPPPFRADIRREIDVIEEIARFFGYDRIPVTVPCIPVSEGGRSQNHKRTQEIRESLKGAGFTEAVNYSFMDQRMLDMLCIGPDDTRRKTMALQNPLNAEESLLRTFLVPALVRNLVQNMSVGIRDVRLFEISRVFRNLGGSLPEERHHLGAIACREKLPALWSDSTPEFYAVKGIVETVLSRLRVDDRSFRPSAEPFLHPGKAGDLFAGDEKVGFIGVLHPSVANKLGVKIPKADIVVLELDLDALLSLPAGTVTYAPLPRFPFIDRDIALVLGESVAAGTVMDLIRAYPSNLIEAVSVFDSYQGKNIPEGKKSLAFSIRYRSPERTLTDAEIEELHGRIAKYLIDKTGGAVRGA